MSLSDVSIYIEDNTENLDTINSWTYKKKFERIYQILSAKVNTGWLIKTYEKKRYAEKERNNLRILKGIKGVPKLLGSAFSDTGVNYIIISECEGLDLFDYVQKWGKLNENSAKKIIIQSLETLKKMHKLKIVHKDIKPENIIYNKKEDITTIIDFEGKYTPDYCSPEQVKKEAVTTKTDIWSLGITLYFLLTEKVPFHSEKDILTKKLSFPKEFSEKLKDFLSHLLERDNYKRYSAKNALLHEWITTI